MTGSYFEYVFCLTFLHVLLNQTQKTLKQLYLTSFSFVSGIIVFGGLLAPIVSFYYSFPCNFQATLHFCIYVDCYFCTFGLFYGLCCIRFELRFFVFSFLACSSILLFNKETHKNGYAMLRTLVLKCACIFLYEDRLIYRRRCNYIFSLFCN